MDKEEFYDKEKVSRMFERFKSLEEIMTKVDNIDKLIKEIKKLEH